VPVRRLDWTVSPLFPDHSYTPPVHWSVHDPGVAPRFASCGGAQARAHAALRGAGLARTRAWRWQHRLEPLQKHRGGCH